MYILIAIVVLIVILLIAAAASADSYIIEREIIINRPNDVVFDYIKYLNNQEHFNKWVMTDPNAKKTLTGIDGTVGYIYAWESNDKQLGKGEQEIIDIIDEQQVDTEVRFEKPFKAISHASFMTSVTANNYTRVQWIFKGTRNYPMKIMHLVLNLKKMLGKDMQISLDNLKTILEK